MVAETPALDDLRMSAETPELIICLDAQKPNRGAEFFCVWSQKLRHWMICVCPQKKYLQTVMNDKLRQNLTAFRLVSYMFHRLEIETGRHNNVWSQKLRYWMICVSFMFSLASLVQIV